jgi:drug/metabolite transporter (DMT)-like permease
MTLNFRAACVQAPTQPADMHKKSLFAEFVLVLVAIVWGINPPAIKLGLQYIAPQPYNVARFIVASLVALFALWLSGTYRRVSRADLWTFCRVSAFGFFIFQVLLTEGIQRTTSGNASFMLCLMPVSVLLINKFYGLEQITRPVVVGIAFSLAGVALIVIGAGRELSLASDHLLGTLLILVAQVAYAYYMVFSKELLARYSSYQVTAYLIVMTSVMLLALSAPDVMRVQWTQVPAIAWTSVLFSGILGLCIGNFLWIWGSGIIGTSRVAIFNNLSPVFAVITAYFLLGETFGLLQAAGAACVFAGVYITRNRDRYLRK